MSFVWDVNDAGVVAGNYLDGIYSQAFTYEGGSYTFPAVSGATQTSAMGINDFGTVAGFYLDSTGYHGYTYDGTSYTTLDVPVGVGYDTRIHDVNNSGVVTGSYLEDVGGVSRHRSFIFDGISYTYLDVGGADHTLAYSINDSGVVVGEYRDPTGIHGFIYDGGSYTTLDVPWATETIIFGINDSGDLVGHYKNAAGIHGFIATPPDATIPASALIGPGGGSVATADGNVQINIPMGALNSDTLISITYSDNGKLFSLSTPSGTGTAIYQVNIQPEGTIFNYPITAIFSWDDADNDGVVDGTSILETDLVILKNGVVFSSCAGNTLCDTDANRLVVQLGSFSDFTLMFIENYSPTAEAGPDQSVHVDTVATLDGSGSTDPEEDYPLTYAWSLTTIPTGSTATLSDPTAIKPSFTADMLGDYTAELVVTDSQGNTGVVDTVLVSTTNTPPVADAGPDLFEPTPGVAVQLDGTQSYDLEGDPITFEWFETKNVICLNGTIPVTFSDPSSPTTDATGYVAGCIYDIALKVCDPWACGTDRMEVAYGANVAPVADAGSNQSGVIGDTFMLDGTNSSDANGDGLTFSWSFVSTPAGSTAALTGGGTAMPLFTADLAGTYVASLVVNDGSIDSDPANVSVEVVTAQTALTAVLGEAVWTVNDLDPGMLKNRNMANALTNKLNSALGMIDAGDYAEALDKLANDVLGKTDGCAAGGSPDKNDWIRGCTAQAQVYPLVMEAVGLLRNLI